MNLLNLILLGTFALSAKKHFKRYALPKKKAKCLDGSKAYYYLYKSKRSKQLSIILDGGGYCASNKKCLNTIKINSATKLKTKKVRIDNVKSNTGISEIIPKLPIMNIAYFPYCSQDLWLGHVRRKIKKNNLYFHGERIREQAIKSMIQTLNFENIESVYIIGSQGRIEPVGRRCSSKARFSSRCGVFYMLFGLLDILLGLFSIFYTFS